MINLLPEEEKVFLYKDLQKKITIILGSLSILSFLVFILILFFVQLRMEFLVNEKKIVLIEKKNELQENRFQKTEGKIKILNQDFKQINPVFQKTGYLTEILNEIASLLPSDVYLTNLSYRQEKKEVSLSGYCPTRELLAELKYNFEKSSFFQDIEFPASNWAKPKEIEFIFTVKLKQ